jgi:hypothetical protein
MRAMTYAVLALGLAASTARADRPEGAGSRHASHETNTTSSSSSAPASSGASHHTESTAVHRTDAPTSTHTETEAATGARTVNTLLTEAQRRHPRAGTGTGDNDRHGRGGYYGGYPGRYGYYGDPYYYGYPYGYPYGYGYGSSYGYGYGYGRSYGRQRDAGSLRVIVEPKRARVYVDGYYAGIADDFDGLFQRLYVSPGRHEIALKLDGYRTQVYRVYVPYDHTIKLHHVMASGDGLDRNEEMAAAPGGYDRYEDDRDRDRDGDRRDRDRDRDRDGDRDRDRDRGRDGDRDRDRGDGGTLRLVVRPADASVYVDGQFRGNGLDSGLVRLAPGHHRVELVRPGYRTVERDVDIRAGQEATLDLDLDRQ